MATVRFLCAILVGALFFGPRTGLAQDDAGAKVVVPSILAKGVDESTADILTDLLLDALLNRHGISTIGPSDLRDLLTVEQQRQLLGCAEDSCMAEIGGSLGARHLISGTVGRIGKVHVLSLRLIDSHESKTIGRASLKLKSPEDAIDAIGPMTDQLLGKQARQVGADAIPAFAGTATPPKQKETLDVRSFCKLATRQRDALDKGPWTKKLIEQRGALLEDLLLTASKGTFDEKTECVRRGGRWVGDGLLEKVNAAKTAEAAAERRRLLHEWFALWDDVRRVEEAHTMGLEKVKLGTGGMPTALPFEVKEKVPPVAEKSPEVALFKKQYVAASKTVGRALAVAKTGTAEAFEALYTPKEEGKSRTSPSYLFDRHQQGWKDGARYETCPLWLLDADALERGARRLAEEKVLGGCVRKWSADGRASIDDDVRLTLHEGQWHILKW